MKRYECRWRVYAKKADFECIGRELGISPYTVRVLRNRGLTSAEEMKRYLYDGYESLTTWEAFAKLLHNPWELAGMERACTLLAGAAAEGKRIRIIGDYDIDGVTSIYILYTALIRLTQSVDWRIPDRMKDGYGLNRSFVEEAAEDGIDLLLTCDNGIAAHAEIALAKELGMQVVVTDHHEVLMEENAQGEMCEQLPPADAVVNPKQSACGYPFSGICGAVVAWKVVTCLYERCGCNLQPMYDYIPYAAIATVGDVMDLVDENRIIVKMGLRLLQQTKDAGLLALMRAQGVDRSAVRAYHIGFVIGPVLNAGGRLSTAQRAVQLLLSTDEAEAEALAAELKALNDRRKELTANAVAAAMELIEERGYENDCVLVLYLPDCHESIAGIVAGRVREKYNRPVLVLTDSSGGDVKGSGRSIPAYHMFEALSRCRPLLLRFGGHPMAAGLTLRRENVEALRTQLNAQCGLTQADLTLTEWIDIPLPPECVTFAWVRELQRLEPFGKGNEKPVFAMRNARIAKAAVFGKNRNVLKLSVLSEGGTYVSDALYFGDAAALLDECRRKYSDAETERMLRGEPNEVRLSLMYYPDINEYNGRQQLRLIISDYC